MRVNDNGTYETTSIELIKMLRERTGGGLKEEKDWVDAWLLRTAYPEFNKALDVIVSELAKTRIAGTSYTIELERVVLTRMGYDHNRCIKQFPHSY